MNFRNTFHLHPLAAATLFVPCGGRPEAVDVSNVSRLFDANGAPHYKYIVEGANLFFTQEARLRLEKAGVVIFKDASANKGGVTSSSLEVLAALALSDSEFAANMQIHDNSVPQFYESYVTDVQRIIERNAALECDCILIESKRSGTANSIIADEISKSINRLKDELEAGSRLWDNWDLRRIVFADIFPPTLRKLISVEELLKRVPESYLRALFASHLASRFVYKYGTEPSQFAFFEFMEPYFARLMAPQKSESVS